jgi:hypothetical protein
MKCKLTVFILINALGVYLKTNLEGGVYKREACIRERRLFQTIHIITSKIQNLDTIHTNSASAAKCIELLNIKYKNS